MFDTKFLQNAWEFNCGVTQRSELQWVALEEFQKLPYWYE